MWTVIHEILTSPGGSFAFVGALLVFALWSVYYVTKHVTEIQTNHDNLSKTTEKIKDELVEIHHNMARQSDLNNMRKDFQSEVFNLSKEFAALRGFLSSKDQNELAQSHSPLSLTEKGKEASVEMEAEERVNRNWDKIKASLDKDVIDKNAYDIQQYCLVTAAGEPQKFFNEEDVRELKLFAYKKGRTFEYISIVLALIIRDRYFKERNIPTSDVDRFDPVKQDKEK